MSKITIAAAGRATIDPANPGLVPVSRRAAILCLMSGDAHFGWNSNVDETGDNTAGIPLPLGQPMTLGSDTLNLDAPLYLYSTGGAVVHYQELLKP